MGTVPAQTWVCDQSGRLVRPWRNPRIFGEVEPPSFVRGVTRADSTNTGPRIPEISLSNYAGTFSNVPANTVVSGLAITGRTACEQNNTTFRDCLIKVGVNPTPGTTYTAGRVSVAGVKGSRYEFCRISPSNPTVDIYGFQGRDFTLYRTDLAGVVDGIVGHGYAGYVNGHISIEDSFIHGLLTYANDPRQSGTPSHGDGAQFPGGASFAILGSTIFGGNTSAVLVKDDTALGYPYCTIDQSYIDIEYPNGGAGVNVVGAIPNLTIKRTAFGRSSPTRPRLLISSAAMALSSTYIPTTGADKNYWIDDPSTGVTISNGG